MSISLLWFMYCYWLNDSVFMFLLKSSEIVKGYIIKIINLSCNRLPLSISAAQRWFLDSLPFSAHMYTFGPPPSTNYGAYVKCFCQTLLLTYHHHLIHNAFKYLSMKRYQTLKRLESNIKHRTTWLNGWLLVYELSGCGFESRCCHLIENQVEWINVSWF